MTCEDLHALNDTHSYLTQWVREEQSGEHK